MVGILPKHAALRRADRQPPHRTNDEWLPDGSYLSEHSMTLMLAHSTKRNAQARRPRSSSKSLLGLHRAAVRRHYTAAASEGGVPHRG